VQLLQNLFSQYVQDINENISPAYVPHDFILIVATGTGTLYQGGKDNLFYNLGKCLQKSNNGSTRMPLDRMPFGLISHNLKFFSVDNAGTLQTPDDYKSWMETMYSRFGQSWAALHLRPMWSFEESHSKEDNKEYQRKDPDIDILAIALEESGLSSVCSQEDSCSTILLPESTKTDNMHVEDILPANETPVIPNYSMDIHTNTNLDSVEACLVTQPSTISSANNTGSSSVQPKKSYSRLWANLSKEQAEELNDADVSIKEVEERFNIQPVRHTGSSYSVPKLSAKVRFNLSLLFLHFLNKQTTTIKMVH
jgi:hypothetical protein